MTRSLPTSLLAVSQIALLAACQAAARTPAEPDPTEARAPVAIEAPEARPAFVGVVTSRLNKVITAEVEAKIETMSITFSQRVRAGDPVAKLDESVLREQLESAKFRERALAGDVGAAAIRARQATREAKNARLLARAGASPMMAVRNAQAEAASLGASTASASGHFAEAKNSRKQIETLIAKTTLVAPIDGVITMITAREGEIAQKGTPIARVFDDRDLMIRFAVPREHRALIAMHQRVEIIVEDAAGPVWAIVNAISDELEPPVNFTIVEADIDDARLRPGELRVASNGKVRIAR